MSGINDTRTLGPKCPLGLQLQSSADAAETQSNIRARCQRGCTCCVELRLKSTLNGFGRSQSLDFLYLLLLVLSAYRITVSLPVFIT